MNRLISDRLAEQLMAGLERENAIYRLWLEREPWESRLRREIYRRSLRGRWNALCYRVREATAPVRRRIAMRIYYFREED